MRMEWYLTGQTSPAGGGKTTLWLKTGFHVRVGTAVHFHERIDEIIQGRVVGLRDADVTPDGKLDVDNGVSGSRASPSALTIHYLSGLRSGGANAYKR